MTRFLDEFAELREARYRPFADASAVITKPGTTEHHPLSIPAVRDRIVREAVHTGANCPIAQQYPAAHLVNDRRLQCAMRGEVTSCRLQSLASTHALRRPAPEPLVQGIPSCCRRQWLPPPGALGMMMCRDGSDLAFGGGFPVAPGSGVHTPT